MDKFKELVKSNRSCRRFDNAFALNTQTLTDLVELARYTASGANNQPLKYIISSSREENDKIFSCLTWAAYLKEWKGPEPAEQPTGYIVILGDTTISNNFWCDHGIAAQTILLGARARGLAGCMFAAINIKKLKTLLGIGDHLEVKLVIALGKPVEQACIDDVDDGGDIRYFRDENQVHHVPKRKLEDLILKAF
ncbi:nitroreductase family protein [Desulfobacter sp.]|uniref:nitroreductase family protein n=1 Tax=Desulfobacter sp. TaxID=2294 RepID=UPI000E9A39DA|nr:nitroreductase family protein [Desulfobacter sp.]MBP8830460.1 nitroreductase family protein [Desulfobacter sp.]HBT86949.1 nitroreductase [Desulfobacter sp.]